MSTSRTGTGTPGGRWRCAPAGGLIRVDQVPLDDRRGIDLEAVFEGLRAIGWRGYVTVHQTLLPGEEVPDAAARHLAAIRPYLQR